MAAKNEKEALREVFGALRKSGFPFQTAVAHVVNSSGGWKVCESEFPWVDATGKDEYLDLVITNHSGWYMAVECKKTDKEIYNFLRPLGLSNTGEYDRVRCLRGRPNFRLYCEDWALWPRSYESEFCVVSTAGANKRLLERDARLVVCAMDAFARQQEAAFRSGITVPADERLYISVIVTNAPIYSVRYKPTEVSLRSGQFEKEPEDVKTNIPWVRFRKTFIAGAGDAGERTVLIINAEWLGEFLKLLEKSPADNDAHRRPVMLHDPGSLSAR